MYNLHIKKKASVHGSSAGKKSAFGPSGSSGQSLSWFINFLLLPGWNASPSQGFPSTKFAHLCTFVYLGRESHCEK